MIIDMPVATRVMDSEGQYWVEADNGSGHVVSVNRNSPDSQWKSAIEFAEDGCIEAASACARLFIRTKIENWKNEERVKAALHAAKSSENKEMPEWQREMELEEIRLLANQNQYYLQRCAKKGVAPSRPLKNYLRRG